LLVSVVVCFFSTTEILGVLLINDEFPYGLPALPLIRLVLGAGVVAAFVGAVTVAENIRSVD
jgi:hypothetical protein